MKLNALVLFAVLFLFACGKNDDTDMGNIPNIPEGTFSAKINGELFDSPSTAKAILNTLDTTILNTRMFQFTGVDLFTDGVFKNLSIMFNAEGLVLSEGTYSTLGPCHMEELCPFLIYAEQDEANNYVVGSSVENGNFTITFSELDFQVGGKAVGTFSGVLYDDFGENYHEVTDGKFNLIIE